MLRLVPNMARDILYINHGETVRPSAGTKEYHNLTL